MPLVTRRWGIECCQRFFGLDSEAENQIAGDAGARFLLQRWEQSPATFYDDPLQLLRQEWWQAYERPTGQLYRFLDSLPPQALLMDYGCGVGAMARSWILRGGKTLLLEASDLAQAYLRWKYPYPNVAIKPCSWEGWGSLHLEALLCTDVLEHLQNPLEVQRQLWERVIPGGMALLNFSAAYPHAGHLAEAIRQKPRWREWLSTTDLIELEEDAWVQKPSGRR